MINGKKLLEGIFALLDEKKDVFQHINKIVDQQNHWIDNDQTIEFSNSIDTKQRKINRISTIDRRIEEKKQTMEKFHDYNTMQNDIALINSQSLMLNELAKEIYIKEKQLIEAIESKKGDYKKALLDIQVKLKVNNAYKGQKVQKDGYFIDSYK